VRRDLIAALALAQPLSLLLPCLLRKVHPQPLSPVINNERLLKLRTSTLRVRFDIPYLSENMLSHLVPACRLLQPSTGSPAPAGFLLLVALFAVLCGESARPGDGVQQLKVLAAALRGKTQCCLAE
jgi:hypothetical protein